MQDATDITALKRRIRIEVLNELLAGGDGIAAERQRCISILVEMAREERRKIDAHRADIREMFGEKGPPCGRIRLHVPDAECRLEALMQAARRIKG